MNLGKVALYLEYIAFRLRWEYCPEALGGEMSRTTVSLPDDLHDAMQKHGDVNWSAVAAQAFRDTLRKITKGEVVECLTLEERVQRIEKRLAQFPNLGGKNEP